MADPGRLTLAFLRDHPVESAEVLESSTAAQVAALFDRVPARTAAGVIAAMQPRTAANALELLDDERAAELLGALPLQAAAAILRALPEARRAALLSALPTASAVPLRLLLGYPDDSVGSCADPGVTALDASVRAAEALERLRRPDASAGPLVVVDGTRRVLGLVTIGDLLRAPLDARLDAVARPPAALLPAATPVATARTHAAWRTTSVLPVVERRDRLLGLLTREALEAAATRLQPPAAERPGADTLASVLARQYWQSLSGLLGVITSALPPVRQLGDGDGG